TKEKVLKIAVETYQTTPVLVYYDGSGFQGRIGATVVLYINEQEKSLLIYHLSSDAEHIVYESKVVDFILSLYLLTSVIQCIDDHAVISSDSQAAIKALLN
ncbi:hypothetical protein C0995_006095, partial [Termitomyces sp. Mi166